MRSVPILLCLTGLLLPVDVRSQSPDESGAWLRWRDSVALLGGPEIKALLAQEEAGTPSTMRQLRQGVLELREGTLQPGREPLDAALASFCAAQRARPDWWLPWFGTGMAQLALARGSFPVRPAGCHNEGTSYFQDAGLAFAHALEVAPRAREAAEALGDAVEADPRWGLGDVARSALRRFAASGAQQSPNVLLLRARLEREGGGRDSVLPLLRTYLSSGGDSGVGLLEAARERFFQGDRLAAEAEYWEGVRQARSERATAMLRVQLGLIARPGELEEYDTLPAAARPGWVHAFWTRRDIEAGVPPGERLTEHFRRYEVARRGFRPVGLGMGGTTVSAAYRMSQSLLNAPGQAAADSNGGTSRGGSGRSDESVVASALWGEESLLLGPESESDGLDVRGQVYMRHGPPDDMAGPLWVYRTTGREYMIRVNRPYPGTPCNLAAKYCRYEMAGRRPPPEVQRKWESEWRAMLADLKQFDGQMRRFKRILPVAARLYAFPRTETFDGGLVIAFAVPADKLEHVTTDGGVAYQIHLRLIVGPASGAFRIDHDTVRTFVVPAPLAAGEYLQGVEPIPFPPGRYQARLMLTGADSTNGVLLAADSLNLGDGTAELVLSDLIFSRETSTLAWNRGAEKILLDPLGSIRRTESLHLYYEVAGLTSGVSYRSTVELLREAGGRLRAELTLGFSDRSDSSVARVRRRFGLERLKPGNYIVQVTVVSDGRRVIRRSPVTITE